MKQSIIGYEENDNTLSLINTQRTAAKTYIILNMEYNIWLKYKG